MKNRIFKNRIFNSCLFLLLLVSTAAWAHNPTVKLTNLAFDGNGLTFGPVDVGAEKTIILDRLQGGQFSAGRLVFSGDKDAFAISAYNGEAEDTPFLCTSGDYYVGFETNVTRTVTFKVLAAGTMTVDLYSADGIIDDSVVASASIGTCPTYYVACDCDGDTLFWNYQSPVVTCAPGALSVDPTTSLNCTSTYALAHFVTVEAGATCQYSLSATAEECNDADASGTLACW